MRNKVKGFTLIELIVVIAIIGVLAAIMVPTFIGFIRESNVSKCNANAKMIYTGAQSGVVTLTNSGVKLTPGSVFLKNNTDNEAVSSGNSNVKVNLYLGEDFKGYFGFKVNPSGAGVEYAIWSNQPLTNSDIVPMSDSQVEQSVEDGTPKGCYPLS